MVAGNALILTATKSVQILTIQCPQNCCDIVAIVVHCMSNGLWWSNRHYCEFDRGHVVPFVGENLCTRRMVHCHERERIVKIGLPKLTGHAQVVEATARFQFITADLVPLFCG